MLVADQINLFGDYLPFDEVSKTKRNNRRFMTMQEIYGHYSSITRYKCKNCKHLFKLEYSKTYYKCELWRLSNSAATDIRMNNSACGKFELRQDDEVVRIVQGAK